MSYDGFSATELVEKDTFTCSLDVLPIFPVRFALSPQELGCIEKPSSIDEPGSYLVRKLRQGYVYIFVEKPEETDGLTSSDGTWQVFRYSSPAGDVSSCDDPANTDCGHKGEHSFSKYTWPGHYGEGNWVYSGETKPYCWVPTSSSKIWIAYSEYRWPSMFFKKAHKKAFRKKIMQEVDLRGETNWGAYVDEIGNIVEEYKPEECLSPDIEDTLPDEITINLATELEFSHCPFERDTDTPILPSKKECVEVIALFDPLGDIKELRQWLILMEAYQRNYKETNIYPLTTGAISEVMMPSLDDRSGWFEPNDPALRTGWKEKYDDMKCVLDTLGETLQEIVDAAEFLVSDEDDLGFGTLTTLAAEICEANVDIFAREYFCQSLRDATQVFSFTDYGLTVLEKNLLPPAGPDGAAGVWKKISLYTLINSFRKMWSGGRNLLYDAIRKGTYHFDIVFHEISPSLAKLMANGGADEFLDWHEAISEAYSEKGNSKGKLKIATASVKIDTIVDFMSENKRGFETAFLDGTIEAFDENGKKLQTEVYDSNGNLDEIATEKKRKAIRRSKGSVHTKGKITLGVATGNVDIPYITETMEVELKPRRIGAHKRIQIAESGYAALGLFMALWSGYTTLKAIRSQEKKAKPLYDNSFVTGLAASNAMKVASTLAWIGEAGMGFKIALVNLPNTGATISANGVRMLYEKLTEKLKDLTSWKNAKSFKEFNLSYGKSAQAATGAKWVKGLGKASVILGAIVSIIAIKRGTERGDNAEIVGNLLGLVGTLLFFPGLGWGALAVGALFCIASAVVTSYSYDQVEDVIRGSFWGSSTPYWGIGYRMSFDKQIEVAGKIASDNEADHIISLPRKSVYIPSQVFTYSPTGGTYIERPNHTGNIQTYFNEEMERLTELFWYPEIIEHPKGSSSFTIRTPAIKQGFVHNIYVTVKNTSPARRSRRRGRGPSRNVAFTKEYSPGNSTMQVCMNGQYEQITVTVSIVGHKSGLRFEHPEKIIINP